ncbi:MAG: PhzF family phenazine biosynthesis protein [Thermoplasmatota archaeon]
MVRASLVRAFVTDSGEGGSLTAVVKEASDLAPDAMQRMAAAAGTAQTAFVVPATRAEFRLRFFTPKVEIPIGARGIMATFQDLASTGRLGKEEGIRRLQCETAAGLVNVDIYIQEGGEPDRIAMTLGRPEIVTNRVMVGEIAPHIGLDRAKIEKAGAPIQVVSAGTKHVIVPVVSAEALAEIKPAASMGPYLERGRLHGLQAYVVTQTRPRLIVSQRSFAPHLGNAEDSASGISTGAMGAYLLANHIVPGTAPVTAIRVEQGPSLGAPSLIIADVHVDPVMGGFRPTKVKVSGRAKASEEKELSA